MSNLFNNLDFGNIGGAVSDLFGAAGGAQSAKGYTTAAKIAQINAGIVKESTDLQEYSADRALNQNFGKQIATAAGNGLTGGGSAADILASSRTQGALTKQVIQAQGQVSENSYQASAAAYQASAQASQTKSKGDLLGGILKIGAAILPFIP